MTKLFYARVSDSCALYTSHDDPLGTDGQPMVRPRHARRQARRTSCARCWTATRPAPSSARSNPFTGKKVWDYPAPAGRSGVLSTAGGLLFIGGGGGLLALDAKTGKARLEREHLAEHQATPMTYMVGGKQYIALPGPASSSPTPCIDRDPSPVLLDQASRKMLHSPPWRGLTCQEDS